MFGRQRGIRREIWRGGGGTWMEGWMEKGREGKRERKSERQERKIKMGLGDRGIEGDLEGGGVREREAEREE